MYHKNSHVCRSQNKWKRKSSKYIDNTDGNMDDSVVEVKYSKDNIRSHIKSSTYTVDAFVGLDQSCILMNSESLFI